MKQFGFSSFLLLLLVLVGLPATALSLQGRVYTESNKPHIYFQGKLLPLYSHNFNIQSDINELKEGDYISGSGDLNVNQTALYMQSIDSVGLIDLLGIWHTSKWDVFEFIDFSRLNLYASRIQLFTQSPTIFGFQSIRYSISPGFQPNQWSILLVDPQGVQIGSLRISKGKWLEIDILDQATGKVLQRVTLSKLKGPDVRVHK